MRDFDQDSITEAVVRSFAATPNPRLREIIVSLVRHLHDFARDVSLTEQEWAQGIEFLTQVGHITTGQRQEFILLSDVLGLSMLTVAMNNRKPEGCTQATVFGPFHVADAPVYPPGADISNGASGTPCVVQGTVRGLDGRPVPGARLEVWQSDDEGLYDVQRPECAQAQARGVVHSDAQGHFHFRSILPVPYAIPDDGPVGRMLEATGRHPWRPAHLHFMVVAPGYETLVTHVFRRDSAYLDSDAVFAVRDSLVTDWRQNEEGVHALRFDFVLNPAPSAPDGPRGDDA